MKFTPHFINVAVLTLFAVVFPAWGDAQECVLPRAHHPWGRYQIGSWKEVRVTTESFAADGKLQNLSVTDTKSTLTSVNDAGVMLKVEVMVQVDGKQFASPPQNVWNGFYGQAETQRVTVRRIGDTVVTVGGNPCTCEQRQITIDGVRGRTTNVCYSPQVSPYVLRRETLAGEHEGIPVRTVTETIAVNNRVDVLGTTRLTSSVRTTVNQGKTTRVTTEMVCDEVPGGVIEHTSQEFDENGRLIRRSKLELLAYEIHESRTGNEPPRSRRVYRRDRRQDRM